MTGFRTNRIEKGIHQIGPFATDEKFAAFQALLGKRIYEPLGCAIKAGIAYDVVGRRDYQPDNAEVIGFDIQLKCDFDLAVKINAYRHLSIIPLVNFSPDELACKCEYPDCPKHGMDGITMGRIQQARTIAGIPFNVNSAWRCLRHNRDVGSKDDSSHREGYALDIEAINMSQRGIIQGALRDVGFNRFGINRFKGFIHVDDDPEKPADVLWLYRADGTIV